MTDPHTFLEGRAHEWNELAAEHAYEAHQRRERARKAAETPTEAPEGAASAPERAQEPE